MKGLYFTLVGTCSLISILNILYLIHYYRTFDNAVGKEKNTEEGNNFVEIESVKSESEKTKISVALNMKKKSDILLSILLLIVALFIPFVNVIITIYTTLMVVGAVASKRLYK